MRFHVCRDVGAGDSFPSLSKDKMIRSLTPNRESVTENIKRIDLMVPGDYQKFANIGWVIAINGD